MVKGLQFGNHKMKEEKILIILILVSTLILSGINMFTSYANYVTNPPNFLLELGFSQLQINTMSFFLCLGLFSIFWSLIYIGWKKNE